MNLGHRRLFFLDLVFYFMLPAAGLGNIWPGSTMDQLREDSACACLLLSSTWTGAVAVCIVSLLDPRESNSTIHCL